MAQRRHLGLVCAAATLMGAAPLATIFERLTWLAYSAVAVLLVAAVATAARWLRAPLWVQLPAQLATLLLALTWRFPSGGELLGVLPGPATFAGFGRLARDAALDAQSHATPVPDRPGLLFVTVAGIGLVAILVDLCTVALRRPAMAGLPMLAIYSVPVAVHSASVPALPFVVGAAGFLWLLAADNVDRVRRFGRRFTGDGRSVDVWEPSPLAAAGRRLAALGVVLAVALPLAVPGMTGGLLERLGTGGGDGDGDSRGARRPGQTVDLFAELSGRLQQDEVEDLVRVRTNDPRPFYLRFAVADQVTARGFRNGTPSGEPVTRGLPEPPKAASAGISHTVYEARVQVSDRFDMPMLPVYAVPTRTEGLDAGWYYAADRQVLYSPRSSAAGRSYSFEYVRSEFSPDALRAAPSARHELGIDFAGVPAVEPVDDLVRDLTRNARTDYDRVRAIYDYLTSDGFTYSLETEPGSSGVDIVDFLEAKTGFCEQYAAAMTWLVRSAGVPARVAFGFANGDKRDGDVRVLTNRNLHAWTEVYFSGLGWVPFDATPAYGVPGSVVSEWAPDPNRPPEATAGPGAPVDPGTEGPAGPTGGPERGNVDGNEAGEVVVAPRSAAPPWWVFGVLAALLAALVAPAVRRAMLRRGRQRRAVAVRGGPAVAGSDPPPGEMRVVPGGAEAASRARAEAHAAWDELLDTMIDYRVPVDATETPRLTAERLAGRAAMGPAADSVRLLGQAEERARYAREPLGAGQLDQALRTVRRALAGAATRRVRIVAALLPPSVLARWRASLVDAGTRTVLTLGRWRERMLRLSPRRLLTGRAAR
ncbi:MAG TPA: DUF3488 and transglutaminase-like domain-containing protein [Pilimelia sp.]|nr:DUF3488 and transglutaminase-like domain-containing protein [Pilimelia sp.]